MPRDLTLELRQALAAEATGEVVAFLISVIHPLIQAELGGPLRLTHNGESVFVSGVEYHHYPFRVTLPVDDPEELPQLSLEFDAIGLDQTIVRFLRSMPTPPTIELSLARVTDPANAVVEFSQLPFTWRTVKGDLINVSGELRLDEAVIDQIVPGHSFIPSDGFAGSTS